MSSPRHATSPTSPLIAIFLGLPWCLAGCDTKVSTSTTCEIDGREYRPGESFPAPDGCNTCTCTEDGTAACTLIGCPAGCTYGGAVHQPGESFPSTDGCNTCSCEPSGAVSCTERGCVRCEYGGAFHQPGESFPALDGCNTCTCDADGLVSCTEIGCMCDPAREWWRSYVAQSPMECEVIDFACQENTEYFGNDCGCGCEQDASCPQSFDCMPPSECDIEALQRRCPFSQIAR